MDELWDLLGFAGTGDSEEYKQLQIESGVLKRELKSGCEACRESALL